MEINLETPKELFKAVNQIKDKYQFKITINGKEKFNHRFIFNDIDGIVTIDLT